MVTAKAQKVLLHEFRLPGLLGALEEQGPAVPHGHMRHLKETENKQALFDGEQAHQC